MRRTKKGPMRGAMRMKSARVVTPAGQARLGLSGKRQAGMDYEHQTHRRIGGEREEGSRRAGSRR